MGVQGSGSGLARVGWCLAMLLPGCRQPGDPAAAALPVLPVEIVVASRGEGEPPARYPVTFHRDRESTVAPRVSGVIVAIPVRIGERVAAGQLVARIEATPYASARIRAESDVDQRRRATVRNDALLSAGAVSGATRDDAVDALAAAEAALRNARYDEASTVVRAPFGGVLLSRDAEIGETVSPGQRLARVADLSSALLARAAVPRQVATSLRVGDLATLSLWGDAATIDARVRHVGAASDARTGTVEIEFEVARTATVASGAVGSVALAASHDVRERAQRLPPEALLDVDGEKGHVFVVDPATSTARRTGVRVLGFDGDWLRVEGVAPDARVVTAGAGFVVEGQKVRPAAR